MLLDNLLYIRLRKEKIMAEYIYNMNFVGIPSDFIERVMPKANGAFVKVYLYIANAALKGLNYESDEIASALDLLESDVIRAFDFLSENGCIEIDGDKILLGTSKAVPVKQNKEIESKYSDKNVKQLVIDNKTLSDLCQVAQDLLGKTLSDTDIETLYWFYDELSMSPEVITMLLEYCISMDKRNMKYIEKVAIGWHENNINTVEAAVNYMNEKQEKNSFFGNMKKLLGIDRQFSKTEETYLKTWHESYNMSEDMIALAYEYCIIQISKLSFPYINSIIERWYSKGITTVTDAEKDKEEFRGSGDKELEVYKDNTGFNYDEIEKIMQEKYDK